MESRQAVPTAKSAKAETARDFGQLEFRSVGRREESAAQLELGVIFESEWTELEALGGAFDPPDTSPFCVDRNNEEDDQFKLEWAEASWDGKRILLRARSSNLDTPITTLVTFTGSSDEGISLVNGAAAMPWKDPEHTPLTARFTQGTEMLAVDVLDLRPPTAFAQTLLPEVDPAVAALPASVLFGCGGRRRRGLEQSQVDMLAQAAGRRCAGWRLFGSGMARRACGVQRGRPVASRACGSVGRPRSHRACALGRRRSAFSLRAAQRSRRWTCGRGAGVAPRRGSIMDDFTIDARRWCFLDNPARYITSDTSGLFVEPLTRQFRTAKEILSRLASGNGVLLADDVGLGKTTIGALVAWVVACQGKRVRIYAPNALLRRRWAEELERHVPMLRRIGAALTASSKAGSQLNADTIQVATHHALVKNHRHGQQRADCDLMIIDEAHRAKGDGSAFNEALRNLGDRAKRKLISPLRPSASGSPNWNNCYSSSAPESSRG